MNNGDGMRTTPFTFEEGLVFMTCQTLRTRLQTFPPIATWNGGPSAMVAPIYVQGRSGLRWDTENNTHVQIPGFSLPLWQVQGEAVARYWSLLEPPASLPFPRWSPWPHAIRTSIQARRLRSKGITDPGRLITRPGTPVPYVGRS